MTLILSFLPFVAFGCCCCYTTAHIANSDASIPHPPVFCRQKDLCLRLIWLLCCHCCVVFCCVITAFQSTPVLQQNNAYGAFADWMLCCCCCSYDCCCDCIYGCCCLNIATYASGTCCFVNKTFAV